VKPKKRWLIHCPMIGADRGCPYCVCVCGVCVCVCAFVFGLVCVCVCVHKIIKGTLFHHDKEMCLASLSLSESFAL
jgi:hypothetical protein